MRIALVSESLFKHALIAIPFSRSSGFAIDSLRGLFEAACTSLVPADTQMSVVFDEAPENSSTKAAEVDLCGFPWQRATPKASADYAARVHAHGVDFVLGLDLHATSNVYRPLRNAGVRTIISYLGAPSSSINSGPKLWLKRLQVALHREGPDHHVFETEAMRDTGVRGRGIAIERTSVIPLGVDTDQFRPDAAFAGYAYEQFAIPRDRHLVFYSGHFEERKGVAVLMRAAIDLVERRGRRDIHFVLTGNRENEADRFREMIAQSVARDFVTFAGYRSDVRLLHRSCSCGVIPSTGWDSMTVSSVEMQSSGLPLLVSRLQGLPETIIESETGQSFAPGAESELAQLLCELIDDPARRHRMSQQARARALARFSRAKQVDALAVVIEQSIRRTRAHL